MKKDDQFNEQKPTKKHKIINTQNKREKKRLKKQRHIKSNQTKMHTLTRQERKQHKIKSDT